MTVIRALAFLKENGFHYREVYIRPGTQLMRAVYSLDAKKTYFVIIYRHVLVIDHRHIIDNSFPEGIMPEKYPLRSARVENIFEISQTPFNQTISMKCS